MCTGSAARVPNDVPLSPSSDDTPLCGPPSLRALSSSTLPQSANSVDLHRDDAFARQTLSSGEAFRYCFVGGSLTSPWSSAAQSLPRQRATATPNQDCRGEQQCSSAIWFTPLARSRVSRRDPFPQLGYPGKDQAWDSRRRAYSTPSFNLSRRVDSETDELMHDVFGVSTVCRFYDNKNSYGSRTLSGTFDSRCV